MNYLGSLSFHSVCRWAFNRIYFLNGKDNFFRYSCIEEASPISSKTESPHAIFSHISHLRHEEKLRSNIEGVTTTDS